MALRLAAYSALSVNCTTINSWSEEGRVQGIENNYKAALATVKESNMSNKPGGPLSNSHAGRIIFDHVMFGID